MFQDVIMIRLGIANMYWTKYLPLYQLVTIIVRQSVTIIACQLIIIIGFILLVISSIAEFKWNRFLCWLAIDYQLFAFMYLFLLKCFLLFLY